MVALAGAVWLAAALSPLTVTDGEGAASATIVATFRADADSRVHEATPTTNYGTRTLLRVDGAGDPDIESYLRFTVSGLAGPVVRATVRLHATTATVDGPTISASGSDWVETALTWNNRPLPTSAPADDEGTITAGSWIELDVTPLVSGNGTFSFLVAATSRDGVDFDSRESTSTSLRPELVVEVQASDAPLSISPPEISGSPQEGETLSASPGVWSGSQPLTFDYQWRRCNATGGNCVDIPDATAQNYTLEQLDTGATVSVAVTATNDYGVVTASSSPTNVVLGAGDVVITAAGDIAGCTWSSDTATAELIESIGPSRVLTLGDHVYPDGSDAEFASCYEPTWGRHKLKTHPAVGNHEYHTPGATGYFNYFGAAAGDSGKGYYAFDLGSWRFYALNSNCIEIACGPGSEQEQWLRDDIAANPRSCIAAFMHHPRFASGADSHRRDNQDLASLFQAFYEASGDLWLSGHNHWYERLTRLTPSGAIDLDTGVRLFVVGTGGAGLTAWATPTTGSEVRTSTHGVLKLTLRDGGYDWAFIQAPGATSTDGGADTCGSAPDDTTPPGAPTGLVLSSSGPSTVGLSWAASSDDLGVVAYDVYRNGVLLDSVTTDSYSDTSVEASSTYTYHVTARDAAGNASGPSDPITVTVVEPTFITFAADGDARVMEAKPASNFGSSSVLRTDGGNDPDIESYLRFTVTGGSGMVERAILRVHSSNATVDGPSVYGTDNSWTEKGITWNNHPARTTAAIDDEGAIAAGTWVEYDVTSFVSTSGTFSFVLATTSPDGVDFYSRNSSQTALRPQLAVTFG